MPKNSRKSRKRNDKKVRLAKLIMVFAASVLVFAAVGMPILKRWLPSNEKKDLNEWFEVSGNEVKIFLDGEACQDHKGTLYDGEIYLPYEYIYDSLNERFYYNSNEQLLTYTLPDEVIDYDAQFEEGNKPSFIIAGDEAYVSLGLVAQYTDISYEAFTSEDETAKRVFIIHGGSSVEQGTIKHKAVLRTAADKKAPILTELTTQL